LQPTQVRKCQILLAHLKEWAVPVDASVAQLLERKLAHHRFRATLPAARWRRVLPVLAAWFARRYGRFDQGWPAVVKDIFNPP
jgi:hypothetical protein